MDLWNVIGKYWLQKYDNKFGVDFFLILTIKVSPLKVKFLVFQTHHVQHLSRGGGVEVLPVPSGDGFEAEDFYQLTINADTFSKLKFV
jgi:hypothetical protein